MAHVPSQESGREMGVLSLGCVPIESLDLYLLYFIKFPGMVLCPTPVDYEKSWALQLSFTIYIVSNRLLS